MQISCKILKNDTKVVVFDLDGTLYSKRGMVKHMMFAAPFDWRMMLIERRIRKQLKGIWTGDEKSFYHLYFSTMAHGHFFSEQYAKRWYETRYMPLMVKVLQKWYKPVQWLLPFLQQCREQGVRLVVLSDYGHTKEKIQALGLDESLFDWVVSAPELGGLKPAPELIARVAATMGVLPQQCLLVGDREDTDGELAKSVNAPFYLVKQ